MNCDCSIDSSDYGVGELYSETIRKARKEHKCCECHETIKAGNLYEVAKALWDGTWGSYKTCITCRTIRNHYCPSGFALGELAEQIRECLGFDYREVETDDE
jgi:hypothetical protein